MKSYFYIIKEIKKINKKCIPLQFLYGILTGLYFSVSLHFPKFIINEIVNQSRWTVAFYLIICMVALVFFVRTITMLVETYTSDNHLRNIYEMKLRVGKKYLEIPFSDTLKKETADRYFNALKSAEALPKMASRFNVGITGCVVRIAVTVVFLTQVSIFCTTLMILSSLVVFFMKIELNKKSNLYRKEKNNTIRVMKYYDNISFDYSAGEQIRLFGIKRFILSQYETLIRSLVNSESGMVRIITLRQTLESAADIFQKVCIYAFLSYSFYKGKVDIADFVVAVPMITTFIAAVNDLLGNIAELKNIDLFTKDFRDWVESKGDEGKHRLRRCASIETIAFRDVSFSYDGSAHKALKHINLRIEKGEKILLAGDNGSGKTTFILLLAGLLRPDSGIVTINGEPMDEIDKKSYWERINAVFQDYNIYNFSLRDNIAMGRNVTDIEICHALQSVNMYEKVTKNQMGLDTYALNQLDENGRVYSGGEQQKIAIARASVVKNNLQILDEPASACDPISEKKLYSDYLSNNPEGITLFVSHRLPVAQECDRILIFNEGQIIEDGTHKELIENNYKYAEMFRRQRELYVDTEEEKCERNMI